MERQFELKVYLPKKVELVDLPSKMFQTKVMKVNAEVARGYMAEKYPDWKRAVLIMTCGRGNHFTAQRILIEKRLTLIDV